MAKHGILFETDNFIPNCINRAGIADDFDIDGGCPVVLGEVIEKDTELYKLTKWTTEDKLGVYVAFNPSVKYDIINGKKFPSRSLDNRDYTNPMKSVTDVFKPEKDIEFAITEDAVKPSDRASVTKGNYLEVEANQTLWKKSDTVTADTPSFKVVRVIESKFPTGDFSEDKSKVFVVRTIQN